MFLLVGVLISLFEMKDLIKERKVKILVFFLLLVILSIVIYYKRNEIYSLKDFINLLKGLFDGDN